MQSTSTRFELKQVLLGFQMLFVAFGALVLIPIIVGFDPSIALFTAGIGTLLFSFLTEQKVPVFLASSFAFVAPIKEASTLYGLGATFGALAMCGVVYMLFSILIRIYGLKKLLEWFPPIVTAPLIIAIGLSLANVATDMAVSFDGSGNYDGLAAFLAIITSTIAIVLALHKKRLLNLFPILIAIAGGYSVALMMGVVDLSAVKSAAWFYNPWQHALAEGRFEWPVWSLAAILLIVPAAIAPALEHIGDMLTISSVSGKNYCEKPGLQKTMLGDGVATSVAGLLGGPPNTTYSEVTGAVAMTRVFEARVMQIAALFAILFSFIGKLSALFSTIPTPVIGGIMVVIFGMIASVGIRLLLENKPDLSDNRNAIIFAVILVCGVGNFTIELGTYTFGGLGLAAVMGVFLNQVLPYSTPNTDEHIDKGKD